MKFQAFHVNPGEKLKKKDVNNDLSNFMSVFPSVYGFNKRFWKMPLMYNTYMLVRFRFIRGWNSIISRYT